MSRKGRVEILHVRMTRVRIQNHHVFRNIEWSNVIFFDFLEHYGYEYENTGFEDFFFLILKLKFEFQIPSLNFFIILIFISNCFIEVVANILTHL